MYQQINVMVNSIFLLSQGLHTKCMDQRLSHSWMIFLGGVDQRMSTVGRWRRPDWILHELLVAFFAVSVYVLPGFGLNERELIGGKSHDGAISIVETLRVVYEVSLLERKSEGYATNCPQKRTWVFGQWVKISVIDNGTNQPLLMSTIR
jgi:hypothetical protein